MNRGIKDTILAPIMSKDDGMALMASTLAIFVVLILLATTIVPLMVNERREASNVIAESKAWNTAKTGLERGLQQYRRTRVPPYFTDVPFGTGQYTVRYLAGADESGAILSYPNYIMIKSTARVYHVERSVRVLLNSLPWAFHFALYCQNLKVDLLKLPYSTIIGDVYFRGNVETTSPVTGTVYTPAGYSAGTGSVTYHPNPQPPFPSIDKSPHLELINTASGLSQDDLVIDGSSLNLNNYVDNTLYLNGQLEVKQGSVVTGPGTIVTTASVTIDQSTVGDGVMIVSKDQIQVLNYSTVGTGVGRADKDGVVLYSSGQIQIMKSTFYGLSIAAGAIESQLQVSESQVYGGIFATGKIDLSKSTIIGSAVSKTEAVVSECTITRGALPLVESRDLGLEPYIIPGTWLEY